MDGMLVHHRITPSIKFAGTHLYSWVERGTVGAECLAQEHNTMSPARSRTRTARSGVELTNHEATAPPTSVSTPRIYHLKYTKIKKYKYFLILTSKYLTIIHRSGGEQWWIFTEPRSGEVNIHHFHRH